MRKSLQRVGHELLRPTELAPNSDEALPFPDICVVALRERPAAQQAAKELAGDAWRF